MSTPSKRRAKARAWMTTETRRHEVQLADQARRYEARIDAMLAVRGKEDGNIWPQSPSDVPEYLRVTLASTPHQQFDQGIFPSSSSCVALLRVVPMSLPLDDGRSVRWLAWERVR